jgi:HEPN domain-containing protein
MAEVSDAIAGFHAQQAIEKAIKAVMAERAVDFPFSHDLSVLLGLCKQAAIEVPSELDGIDQLTPYAARLRYGGEVSGGVDRATAMRWATTAVAWARGIVKPLTG